MDFSPEQEISLYSIAALQPSQLANRWVPPGFLSAGVNWPGREPDHSPPFSAKVKNQWSSNYTPLCASWRSQGLCLCSFLLFVDRTCYNLYIFTPVILQSPPAVFKLRNIRASTPFPSHISMYSST
jgi:hypothetical protein